MILVRFTKSIDGKAVEMNHAVYASSRLHVPEDLSRGLDWDVEEDIDEDDMNEAIKAVVAKRGYAQVKATRLAKMLFVG